MINDKKVKRTNLCVSIYMCTVRTQVNVLTKNTESSQLKSEKLCVGIRVKKLSKAVVGVRTCVYVRGACEHLIPRPACVVA